MNTSEIIINKRNELGISVKELSDALGLGTNGERLIRSWENGESCPDTEVMSRISSFGDNALYKNQPDEPEFKFIDLFAGIGGIRIPFQELGGECVFSSEWANMHKRHILLILVRCPLVISLKNLRKNTYHRSSTSFVLGFHVSLFQ